MLASLDLVSVVVRSVHRTDEFWDPSLAVEAAAAAAAERWAVIVPRVGAVLVVAVLLVLVPVLGEVVRAGADEGGRAAFEDPPAGAVALFEGGKSSRRRLFASVDGSGGIDGGDAGKSIPWLRSSASSMARWYCVWASRWASAASRQRCSWRRRSTSSARRLFLASDSRLAIRSCINILSSPVCFFRRVSMSAFSCPFLGEGG